MCREYMHMNKLDTGIDSIYLVPEFISIEEEASLIDSIARTKACKTQVRHRALGVGFWGWVPLFGRAHHRLACTPLTQLKGRRVLQLGGVVAGPVLLPAPLPFWIHGVGQRVNDLGLWLSCFNHVLVNEYETNGGIMVRQHHAHAINNLNRLHSPTKMVQSMSPVSSFCRSGAPQ